jgi:hypothetical protein
LPAVIKKKYLEYSSFAGQTVETIFGEKLNGVKKYEASMLQSVQLMNNGKGGFIIKSLPEPVQWAPVFGFLTEDLNRDGLTDIFAVGNFYGVLPYEGRYDANSGTVLINKGNESYEIPGPGYTGFAVTGEARDIKSIKTIDGSILIAVARNNDQVQFFGKFDKELTELYDLMLKN